jgi:hypothetical protein
MPRLVNKLKQWDITEVVICSSFNKIGYLMSPDVESYVDTAKQNDAESYQLMAMSTLASGSIPAKTAYEFINRQNIQSVVFGASDKKHIEETVGLIHIRKDIYPHNRRYLLHKPFRRSLASESDDHSYHPIVAIGAVAFSVVSLVLPFETSPSPMNTPPEAFMLINDSSSSGSGLSSMPNS